MLLKLGAADGRHNFSESGHAMHHLGARYSALPSLSIRAEPICGVTPLGCTGP